MQQAGDDTGQGPAYTAPPGACDCHIHVFGPRERFAFAEGRIYTPPDAAPGAYLELRRRLGLERVVIVQPSVYGTDNSRHLLALSEIPGARGVAVLAGDEPDAEIARLHEAGFRGVRLNLRQGIGAGPIGESFERLAARLRDFGWHLQINASATEIRDAAPMLARSPVAIIFDHYAGLSPWIGIDQPGFEAVVGLLETGQCWAKLSAPYIHDEEGVPRDFAKAAELVAVLVERAPGQLVWGSNWPHPGFVPPTTADAEPTAPFRVVDDGEMLALFAGWVGDRAALGRILVDNPAHFYGF